MNAISLEDDAMFEVEPDQSRGGWENGRPVKKPAVRSIRGFFVQISKMPVASLRLRGVEVARRSH